MQGIRLHYTKSLYNLSILEDATLLVDVISSKGYFYTETLEGKHIQEMFRNKIIF